MSPTPRFWTDRLGRAFALDLRSLAAMRFALGLLLLFDTLSRFAELGAFYTDAGVLPRALQVQTVSGWRWSLHLANGSAGFQALLLLLEAGAALAMAFGWRTRAATLLAWVLCLSLMNRNPLVLGAGDREGVAGPGAGARLGVRRERTAAGGQGDAERHHHR